MFKTLIIDGPYLAHRSHGAPYLLTTKDGRNATMIHSFMRTLNSLRKQLNPNHIILAWESPNTPSRRREQSPSYKPSTGINPEYITQLKDLQKLLYLLNIPQYNSPRNEADDVIASYIKTIQPTEQVVIFTVDKDIMQLINENCQVYDGKEFYDVNKVKQKFGVKPNQIPDLLAIAGDKADNIQGLNGIGFKKASNIINEYGCIEELPIPVCNSNMVISAQMINKISNNKKLTLLNHNCSLEKIPKEPVTETIDDILNKYELKSIKEKIEEYKLIGGAR